MNQQEYDQLSDIHRHVYGYSAVVGVALNALEYQNIRQNTYDEEMETAHIELVLKNLAYDIAEQCEKLEKMLEQFKANGKAVEGGAA